MAEVDILEKSTCGPPIHRRDNVFMAKTNFMGPDTPK